MYNLKRDSLKILKNLFHFRYYIFMFYFFSLFKYYFPFYIINLIYNII